MNKHETKELKEFVIELQEDSLSAFINELTERPKKLSVYKNRTKDDWITYCETQGSTSIGASAIYNFLHPRVIDDEEAAFFSELNNQLKKRKVSETGI